MNDNPEENQTEEENQVEENQVDEHKLTSDDQAFQKEETNGAELDESFDELDSTKSFDEEEDSEGLTFEQDSFEQQDDPKENAEETISVESMPISLNVEIGTLSMSAKELIELSTGNILSLNERQQGIVHLTKQGKKVAKAELVQAGELCGVRILELY